MKRTYQSRRRKVQTSSNENDTKFSDAFMDHASNDANHTKEPQSPSSKQNANANDNEQIKHICHTHTYRRIHPKSPLKRLGSNNETKKGTRHKKEKPEKAHGYNLRARKNRITTSNTTNIHNNGNNSDNDKENGIILPFNINKHHKEMDDKKFAECQNSIIITESVDSTTSFLSALSLNKNRLNMNGKIDSKQQKKQNIQNKQKESNHKIKQQCIVKKNDDDDGLTLDDICNDAIDISEPLYDPESISQNKWPSWVPKHMIPQKTKKKNSINELSPSRKRKRNENNHSINLSAAPPSKKLKSPHTAIKAKSRLNHHHDTVKPIFSTVRKTKKRSRRRSSLNYVSDTDDMITPIASIRTQRIHRLTRKSNTDLLMDVLLRDENNNKCQQLNKIKKEIYKNQNNKEMLFKTGDSKITLVEMNGLHSIGRIDGLMESVCLYLLSLGADALLLNSDGVSPIYVAMHYTNNFKIISSMIARSVEENYDELNQTYTFPEHGTMSLLDVALRIGQAKTIKIMLENDLMATKHSIEIEPRVQLIAFCKKHRMTKLANKVLKEQLFEAVDNLDVEYIESIICHGIDINCKIQQNKSSLYYVVQQPMDIYDDEDAKEQYETIECLLKNDANPNYLDSSKTPMLTYPLQRTGQWNIKLVELLLHYGANLKLKVGDTAKTLYLYAKENCVDDEILNIIKKYHNNKNRKIVKNIGKNRKHPQIKEIEKTMVNSKDMNDTKVINLNVAANHPMLGTAIKTQILVKKKYQRNKKSQK